MIEVEKKFLLTPEQQRTLLTDAQKLNEKSFEDSYFDTNDYRLTTNNLWFRKRDGTYELKVPLKSEAGISTLDKFHEITEIEEIRRELNLLASRSFESALSYADIKRFMTCSTYRESYEKQGFRIDIDSVTYLNSNFTYAIAEIELLVNTESETNAAEDRIIKFAKSFDLTTDKFILGKVAMYLKMEKPEHYEALVNAGVLE